MGGLVEANAELKEEVATLFDEQAEAFLEMAANETALVQDQLDAANALNAELEADVQNALIFGNKG